MVSGKCQKKFIEGIKKQILTHLERQSGKSPQEILHDFRVALKKLKALQEFSGKSKKKKLLQPAHEVFKQTGKIRDMGNANELEERYHQITFAIRRSRQQEFNTGYQAFVARSPEHLRIIKKACRLLSQNCSDITIQQIKRRYQREITKIAEGLMFSQARGIHQCRKKIKNLLYFYEVLNKSQKKQLNLRLEYLQELQEKIGNWHDLHCAMPVLKRRIQEPEVLTVMAKEKEKMLTSIRNMGKNLFWRSIQYSN